MKDILVELDSFTLDIKTKIPDGKLTAILGPSGSGKTTILNVISGIISPDKGKLFFGAEDVTDQPPQKRKIGFVFQDYALFPHMNVEENIAFGLHNGKYDKEYIRTRIKELMKIMHLEKYEKRRTDSLSGGEKQRVAIARAISYRPKILLFDEPMSALDRHLREKLIEEIRKIQKELNITTIYVTHDQTEAFSISDNIIVLKDGRIIQEGKPEEIYENPVSTDVAAFLGNGNLIPLEKALEAGFIDNIDKEIKEFGKYKYIYVKYEDVIIDKNGINVKIIDSSFHGFYTVVKLSTGNIVLKSIVYRKNNGLLFNIGDEIRVSLKAWKVLDK